MWWHSVIFIGWRVAAWSLPAGIWVTCFLSLWQTEHKEYFFLRVLFNDFEKPLMSSFAVSYFTVHELAKPEARRKDHNRKTDSGFVYTKVIVSNQEPPESCTVRALSGVDTGYCTSYLWVSRCFFLLSFPLASASSFSRALFARTRNEDPSQNS